MARVVLSPLMKREVNMMHDAESTEQETIPTDVEVEFTDLDLPDETGRSPSLLFAFTLLHWQRSLKRLRSRPYWPSVSTLSKFLMLVISFRRGNVLSSPLLYTLTSALL